MKVVEADLRVALQHSVIMNRLRVPRTMRVFQSCHVRSLRRDPAKDDSRAEVVVRDVSEDLVSPSCAVCLDAKCA